MQIYILSIFTFFYSYSIYSSLKTKENLETVKLLPVEKLLIETDCPWCEIRPSHAGYSLISKSSFHESVKKEKWNSTSMVKGRNEPANIR